MKVPRIDETLKEERGEKGKLGEGRNGEKGIGGKAVATGDRPVSLFQFLRETPVLKSIMAEYEAKKSVVSKLSTA